MGLDHLTFDPISGLLKAIDRNPAFKMSGAKDEAKTTSESVMDKFIPRVKAEEEDEPEEEEEDEEDLVDPAVQIKEDCANSAACISSKERLDACNERVNSKENTEETCLEEILDFYHCMDHCAGPKIFANLKKDFQLRLQKLHFQLITFFYDAPPLQNMFIS